MTTNIPKILFAALLLSVAFTSCKEGTKATEKEESPKNETKIIKQENDSLKRKIISDSIKQAEERKITTSQSVPSVSKEETIDWLNNKFGDRQFVVKESPGISSALTLKIEHNGFFTVNSYTFTTNESTGVVRKYPTMLRGNFRDLSINSFKALKRHGAIYLQFSCLKSNCINQFDYKVDSEISTNNLERANQNSAVTLAIIEDDNSDLVERSKKAFINLIQLCGGQKEAF